jgi:sulfite reductase alpha subunit-like flavoprotein
MRRVEFPDENTTEGAVIYDPDFSLYRPLNFRMRLHKQVYPEEVVSEVTANKVEEKVRAQAPQPAVGTKPLPRLWAVHASNNGTCEGMAGDVATKAPQLGFTEVQVITLADSPLADPKTKAEVAAGSNFFMICVATYNSEPPDAALSFSDMLDMEMKSGNSSRFAGINFCVFGAGNTQWGPTFQAFVRPSADSSVSRLHYFSEPKKVTQTWLQWAGTAFSRKGLATRMLTRTAISIYRGTRSVYIEASICERLAISRSGSRDSGLLLLRISG